MTSRSLRLREAALMLVLLSFSTQASGQAWQPPVECSIDEIKRVCLAGQNANADALEISIDKEQDDCAKKFVISYRNIRAINQNIPVNGNMIFRDFRNIDVNIINKLDSGELLRLTAKNYSLICQLGKMIYGRSLAFDKKTYAIFGDIINSCDWVKENPFSDCKPSLKSGLTKLRILNGFDPPNDVRDAMGSGGNVQQGGIGAAVVPGAEGDASHQISSKDQPSGAEAEKSRTDGGSNPPNQPKPDNQAGSALEGKNEGDGGRLSNPSMPGEQVTNKEKTKKENEVSQQKVDQPTEPGYWTAFPPIAAMALPFVLGFIAGGALRRLQERRASQHLRRQIFAIKKALNEETYELADSIRKLFERSRRNNKTVIDISHQYHPVYGKGADNEEHLVKTLYMLRLELSKLGEFPLAAINYAEGSGAKLKRAEEENSKFKQELYGLNNELTALKKEISQKDEVIASLKKNENDLATGENLLSAYQADLPQFIREPLEGSRFGSIILDLFGEARRTHPDQAALLEASLRSFETLRRTAGLAAHEIPSYLHDVGKNLYALLAAMNLSLDEQLAEANAWARALNRMSGEKYYVFTVSPGRTFDGMEMLSSTSNSRVGAVKSWGVMNGSRTAVTRKAMVA